MKKSKHTKKLFAIGAAVCLLTALIALGICGGGTLTVEQCIPMWTSSEIYEDTYSARVGLQAGPVTVVADTPWGILIRCHVPSHYLAQWYVLENPTAYEATSGKAETRWFFLRPGESLKIYLDDRTRTEDGVFWTFINPQEEGDVCAYQSAPASGSSFNSSKNLAVISLYSAKSVVFRSFFHSFSLSWNRHFW